jgi:autotransporter-associated beta strand protein
MMKDSFTNNIHATNMKSKAQYFTCLAVVATAAPATADIIYGSLQQTITTDYTGVTVTVGAGTLNPFFGGAGVANNNALQPFRQAPTGLSTLLNFGTGVTIDSGSGSLATGAGGSSDHIGTTFTSGTEGYIGFKLNAANYGWARVVLTNNTSGALVKDWAYDNTGAAIKTGWINTDIVSPTAQTVTLNPGTGDAFTLGSVLANASGSITNSVLKTGAGNATLKEINTYTGTTTVAAGVLAISGSGSINNSSAIQVAAGGTVRYNSSTALTVAPSLNGSGTSNRAVLGGTGPINASVTLDNLGDVLSPGNSPGIQTYTVGQSWGAFSYDWEVNDFTGTTAGTHFDQIGITGTIDLTGGSGSYILNVLGLTAGDVAGLVPDFSEINRSWTILTSTGFTGFNAANWTINTTGFSDPDTGTWLLAQSGNNLMLSYTVIPEPRAALLGGLGMLMLLRRRR